MNLKLEVGGDWIMARTWDRETQTHLKEHVKWPATGKAILEACNLMSHVPESDRMMAKQKRYRRKSAMGGRAAATLGEKACREQNGTDG